MYNYQAAVDRNNAELSRRAADDARTRGQEEENRLRAHVRQTQSSQRVGFAASGIDLGSDVVLDTLADTAYVGELDAMTIRDNTAKDVWKYNVEAQNYESSAGMKVSAGKNAKSASWLDAGSTILGGAATISDRWAQYKKTGVFA